MLSEADGWQLEEGESKGGSPLALFPGLPSFLHFSICFDNEVGECYCQLDGWEGGGGWGYPLHCAHVYCHKTWCT